jgi:C4-dicarboxylate transporter DctM subunit
MFGSLDSFTLLAVPFFMLSGAIMEGGGVSRRLINMFSLFLGRLPGGLAIIAIVASTFFGAISGSAPATVAAIGGIMLPAMLKAGYNRAFALATMATAGCLGSVIPPSIMMVSYGVSANASIGDLFIIGILPGLMLCLAFSAFAYVYGKKHGYYLTKDEIARTTAAEKFSTIFASLPALLMPLIVLGGIYGGIFTPTEAGNVASVYGLFVGFFIYKELKIRSLPKVALETVITTSMVLIIIGAAGAFGSIMTKFQIPAKIATYMISLSDNPLVFLLFVNILLFIVGTFMEANAAIILIAPILVPIAQALHIDILFFGIIMVVNMVFGLLTPPVGINLFVACGISGDKLEEILKKPLWAYVFIFFAMLMIFTYVPDFTLLLFRLIRA